MIVGVNEFVAETELPIQLQSIDPAAESRQRRADAQRCAPSATPKTQRGALAAVRDAANGTENILVPMRAALRAHCTIGEICGVLREEWGEHDRERAPR